MTKNYCTNCDFGNPTDSKYCSKCGYSLPKIETKTTIESKPTNEPSQNNAKGKIIGSIIGLVVFAITYAAVQNFFFNTSAFDKALMQTASEINESCPIMIDSETRLDNTIALPDKVLQYNYTLVNMEKDSIDLQGLKNYLEPNVTNFVKTSPDMETFRENNATINYYYKDKSQVYLFTISVTPDLYK
jgi:hypothetical protein